MIHPTGLAVAIYLVGVIAIAMWARTRVLEVEDFVVAGRTLSFGVTTSSLLATWIGAGALLVAADEIGDVGLSAIVGEPLGGGLALIIGALVAGRIRSYRVFTLPDLFRQMYGPRAEGLLSAITLAIDLTWTAVQYIALGSIIELYLGVPNHLAVPAVALVGLVKTLLGGMHAVAMSDTVHLVFVVVAMVLVALGCLVALGDGALLDGLLALGTLPPRHLGVLPETHEALPWIALAISASVGNSTDPALVHRVSSARTPRIATLSCLVAGLAYIGLGCAPIIVGLTASLAVPAATESVMPTLAGLVLSPWAAAAVMMAIVATLMSTVDSALLTQSAIVARNVGNRLLGFEETVTLHRLSVILVAGMTVGLTMLGVRPFRLLTLSYEAGLVATVLPILLGMWWPAKETTALASIGIGGASWLYMTVSGQSVLGLPVPAALVSAAAASLTYLGLNALTCVRMRPDAATPAN